MLRRLSVLLVTLGVTATWPAHAQWAGDSRFRDSFPHPTRPTAATPLAGNYVTHSFDAYDGALTLETSTGTTVRVRPWAQGVVRVEVYPQGRPTRPDSSISVVVPPSPNLVADTYSTMPTLEMVCRDGFRVSIRKYPVRLTFISAHGDTLLAEAPGGASQRPAAPLPELGLNFRLKPGEALYGTGARALPANRRGQRLPLYNAAHYSYQNGDNQLNYTVPVVISSGGYGLFVDNYTAGYFDLGAADKNELRYGGEELNQLAYYFIAGPEYATILDRYSHLTGRQPLPPRWALGLIQSRFGYKTEREMYAVARRMRAAGFPLDALVLDLYWFGTTKDQGNLAWQHDSFPDPPRMMRRLDSLGVKTILISEPYVMRTSTNDDFVRRNGLIGTDSAGRPYTVASFWAGPASLLDMFKPATDGWLWASYKQRLQEGAGGFWSDLGEPENHPTEIKHRLGYTRRIHNAYGMAWAQIYAKHFAREYPERRLFNLARSGWAGGQRLSIFPWSGDIHRSWSGYQAQVPIMLGMAMSGLGYMHSDAGGFCVGPQDNELYTRWLQHSALSPILRPHGEGVPPEPYFYPERYRAAVRQAARERYRLLPYLYTLAWRNATTGAPIVRPVFWDQTTQPPNHLITSSENDAYFLGPDLLVAPVVQPGQRRRNVTLPAGRWYDYRTGRLLSASAYPQTTAVSAPLERTPLLARANAIVPTVRKPMQAIAEYTPADTITLRVFADASAPGTSFTLFDDDGRDAKALEKGRFQTLTATTTPLDGGRVRLTLTPGQNGLPEGARRWLVIDLPTADRWQVEGSAGAMGKGNRVQGGTGPVAVAWPTSPTSVILTNLDAQPRPRPELVAAWLQAPDAYGRIFADMTTIGLPYERAEPGATKLTIRDARGQVVRTLTAPAQPAGQYRFEWDGRDATGRELPAAFYFAELDGQVVRVAKLRE